MATGMVLVIVSRNIDLSVGSLLGFLGYMMALVQTDGMIAFFGLDVTISGLRGSSYVVDRRPRRRRRLGRARRRHHRVHRCLWRRPVVHRDARRLPRLARRHLPHGWQAGPDALPLDETFQLIGGGADGTLGEWRSWLLAVLGCAGVVLSIYLARRGRRRYDLAVRSTWVDVVLAVVGCAAVIGGVALIANRYDSPVTGKPMGVAYPVVILIGVTLVMTYLARRRRFGRYVYAYGGNPEAAELSGINTRRTVMLTFVLMGVLVAVSAAIQTARLNSAVTNLGVQNELDTIAAAVIGGTSFSGGIGTVPGAVLGAIIMQSLRSGMVLLDIDSPSQDVVVGIVLVAAVAVDAALRSGRRRAAGAALVAGLVGAAIVIQTGQP